MEKLPGGARGPEVAGVPPMRGLHPQRLLQVRHEVVGMLETH